MPTNRQSPYTDHEIVIAYAWWERNRDKTTEYYGHEFQIMAARLFATAMQDAPHSVREACERANLAASAAEEPKGESNAPPPR